MAEAPKLVLASASAVRRQLLESAGLAFAVAPAHVDEAALFEEWSRTSPAKPFEGAALMLASAKAAAVSNTQPSAHVIGADQVLVLDDEPLHKVPNRDAARKQLLRLRGRTHELHSAVALAINGKVIWQKVDTARMTMRNFSNAWLEHYLDTAGSALTSSVGCYELEGAGVQLFDAIDGSYFTILGLPLLPLLSELRRQGVIPS